MEQELQETLQPAAAPEPVEGSSFAERIRRRFKGLDTESLPIPARQHASSLSQFLDEPDK
ncbi:MAG: hypothetical protein NTZ64_04570 [Polaromonas sp.]|nr:hypothetical protein [Polaromonas sp.]